MKAFGFMFIFLLIGTAAFVYLSSSSKGSTASNPGSRSVMTLSMKRRMLKAHNMQANIKNEGIHLEDYGPIDPVPSSTSSIRPGPIQHGTPLMPYIPQPSPPPTQETHAK